MSWRCKGCCELMEYCSTVYLSPQTTEVPSNIKVAYFLVLNFKHSFLHKTVILLLPCWIIAKMQLIVLLLAPKIVFNWLRVWKACWPVCSSEN